jgi:CheY-like chemotaxis protein
MKVLVVEDEEENIEAIRERFSSEIPGISLTFAETAEAATHQLTNYEFDLIVLDLRIPSGGSTLDPSEQHGMAVGHTIRQVALGTPVIVFSAYATHKMVAAILRENRQEDICGRGKQPMLQFLAKDQLPELIEAVKRFAADLRDLESVEVSKGLDHFQMHPTEDRVLKLFCRRSGGFSVTVSRLGGGLSSSKVLRVEVYNQAGALSSRSVAKLDSVNKTMAESERYQTHIARGLGIGRLAHKVDEIIAGTGSRAGIFYAVAEEFRRDLFQVLGEDPVGAAQVVSRLREAELPWRAAKVIKTLSVGDIRRMMKLSDQVSRARRG